MTHRHAALPVAETAGPVPVIQRACSCGKSAGVEGQCPDCAAEEKLGLQPRLWVNPPGDAHEREADRMADRVIAGGAGPMPAISARAHPPVQRQPEAEAEDELQMKPAPGPVAGAAPPGFARRLHGAAASGRPLPQAVRRDFEARMGHDLGRVRIHDGVAAQGLSRQIQARAFTHRNDIFFGAGQYDPASTPGRHLLAHELTHTLQQTGGAAPAGLVQRRLQPAPGNSPVCEPPKHVKGGARKTWLRELGKEVHSEIQKKFLAGGRNRLTELTLPFTDTAVCKDLDGYEPPTSTGRPDLAIAERKGGVVNLRLGEIKPYNVTGVSAGAAVMACYENGVIRNADVCKDGADSFIDKYAALIGGYCRRLGANSGQMVQLGKGIGWNPGMVTAKGRAIATINLGGGLIFYGCADLLKNDKKKKKKDKDAKKKKKAQKKAARSEVKKTKKASKAASKEARKGSKKAVKAAGKRVEKKVEKAVAGKVASKAAKKGALKAAGKKLIPGEAYLEAAAIALALLGGAKPAFGGEGMSAEEALLEMARNGLPPDVAISPELMQLLTENPEVMELFRQAAEGQATSDAAAQAMIDLLEANRDLLDAETLEKLAKFAAESGAAELQPSAEKFREQLEKIKAGAKPGTGEAEGEAAGGEDGLDLFDDPAPEADQPDKPKAGARPADPPIPEDFARELDADPARKDLLKEVVQRADSPDFGAEKIAAFRAALEGLTPDQIASLLAALAALPKAQADGGKDENAQTGLEALQQMAAALKAGKPLPAAGAQDAAPPAAGAEAIPDDPTLSEAEAKWAIAGIKWHQKNGGKIYDIGLRLAYSKEDLAAELDKMARLRKASGAAQPDSLGTLIAGIGYRTGDGTRVGTFGSLAVTRIEGQKLILKIRSYKSFVTLDGRPYAPPVSLPDLDSIFADIARSTYDFSKEPAP